MVKHHLPSMAGQCSLTGSRTAARPIPVAKVSKRNLLRGWTGTSETTIIAPGKVRLVVLG